MHFGVEGGKLERADVARIQQHEANIDDIPGGGARKAPHGHRHGRDVSIAEESVDVAVPPQRLHHRQQQGAVA